MQQHKVWVNVSVILLGPRERYMPVGYNALRKTVLLGTVRALFLFAVPIQRGDKTQQPEEETLENKW